MHLLPFIYLGAKHMVTGYDHILFLLGVIFFLYRLKHIALYVSLFAIGHSTTMLLGVYFNVGINSYLIDAIIGLSVVYKALDNMGAFQRWFGFQPNTKVATLIFGFFHGFGLSTKIIEYRDLARRAGAEPARLQRRRRNRPVARARRHPDRHGLLAAHGGLLAPRLHRQRRHDDRRLRADRLSAHRLLPQPRLKDVPMYNTDIPTRAELPSTAQLVKSTIIAIVAAAVILVTIVLPAEYAIDPTGIGRTLQLTEMGEIKKQLADRGRGRPPARPPAGAAGDSARPPVEPQRAARWPVDLAGRRADRRQPERPTRSSSR